jgi:hypothetical protein
LSEPAYFRISPRPAFSAWLAEHGVMPGTFPNAEEAWQFPENRHLGWERPEYNALAKLTFLSLLIVQRGEEPWVRELFEGRVLEDVLVDRHFEFEYLADTPTFPDHYVPENHKFFSHSQVKGRLVAIGRQRVQEYVDKRMREDGSAPLF